MSSERFIQDKLFEEKDLPPKQEFDHYYGWATYEDLDQPMKGKVPDGYYIATIPVKLNIYPSQFKYVDNNFAIVSKGGETTVLTREDRKKWYGPFLNSEYFDAKFPVIENVWVDGRDIVFNPESLKKLEILDGKRLEKATKKEVGGKALGLVELKLYEHMGYKVPDFFVVPTSFVDILQIHGFEGRAEKIMSTYSSPEDIARRDNFFPDYMSEIVPKKIEKLFKSYHYYENIFKPFILPKLKEFHRDYCGKVKNMELIFRSSSSLEDDDGENLFQGVFLSRRTNFGYYDKGSMFVSDKDAYDAFEDVLLSPWACYAEFYLRNRKLIGKVSRSMAEIIQVVPKDIEFMGRAYFDNGKVEVEYIDQNVNSGNWVGNKVFIKDKKVVSRIDNVVDAHRKKKDIPALLLNNRAIRIAKIMEKLSPKFKKFEGRFNIEYCLTKDEIYLLQIRPTKRGIKGAYLPDLSQIDRSKILFECSEFESPFSVGKVIGPVVNLLKYEHYYRGDPQEGYLDEISRLDKEYPGAIFIVRLNIPSIQDIHMLTPNKKGIIVCYEHDTFSRNDHFVEGLYTDPTFHIINVLPQLFTGLDNGTRLGIVSSGEKAVFYRPDSSEPDTIIHDPPTIFKHQYIGGEYVQDRLPLITKRSKKI